MSNDLNSKEIMEDKTKEMAYEKAIEGYQFQVGRYNTWMNYYAIFVGALFIAFYTIMTTDEHNNYILLIIALLGLFASLCWYGALLGYRTWNDRWMQGIHELETKVFGDAFKVYRNMPSTDRPEGKYAAKYVSTQKITKIFIIGVMFAWLVMIGFIIYRMHENCCCAWLWAMVIGLAIFIFIICLHYIGCRLYSSEIIK